VTRALAVDHILFETLARDVNLAHPKARGHVTGVQHKGEKFANSQRRTHCLGRRRILPLSQKLQKADHPCYFEEATDFDDSQLVLIY
jgi:hypothetical protein